MLRQFNVGIVFNEIQSRVALVIQNKGKVGQRRLFTIEGSDPTTLLTHKVKRETSFDIHPTDWIKFCMLRGEDSNTKEPFSIKYYYALTDGAPQTTTDEVSEWYYIKDLYTKVNIAPSDIWIIFMALAYPSTSSVLQPLLYK